MANLPIILAGPILRRVEPRLVTIWMAFSEPQHIELQIWAKIIKTERPKEADPLPLRLFEPEESPDFTYSTDTQRIGTHFHIAFIAYEIPQQHLPLVPNFVYCYNIRFADNSGTQRDLKSEDFLFDKNNAVTDKFSHLAIGMKEGQMPSFSLCPTNLEDVVLLHGSCRKMHGVGKDGLAVANHLILGNVSEPKKRPHQLFLTGDQIYADDVPMLILPHLARQGAALFGEQFDEKITVKNGTTVAATLMNFPPNLRSNITKKWAGMTSDDDHNHLITFYEFAAIYLFSFSNRLWPEALTNITSDISEPAIDLLFDDLVSMIDDCNSNMREFVMTAEELETFATFNNDKRTAWEKKMKLMFKRELTAVLEFRDNLPRIARILANVPVYMIMDDHEVTDDWYITKDWRDKSLSKPLGVNLMRNGMMSYILFQGWGNDPKAYQTGDNLALLNHIKQWAAPGNTEGPTVAAANLIDSFLGFDGNVPKVKLFYNVPTGPTRTYVLDTRTRRAFETRRGTAGLMSPETLLEQLPATLPDAGAEMVFIVSPAPVLGLAVMEELIQPLMNVIVDNLFADTEAWALNFAVFESFLARIEKYKRVVILSGDVHFGFTIWLDYFRSAGVQNIPDIPRARIVQLVASALKNETDKIGNQHILVSGRLQQLQSAAYFPAERLGWMNKIVNVNGPLSPRNEMRRHKNPVVLSPQGWNPGSTVTPKPDWSWRLNMVVDNRPDTAVVGARPEKIRIDTISPDIGWNTAGYTKVVERHQDAFEKNISRRVVWASHIGRVQIRRNAGKLSVDHQFWYLLPEDDLYEEPYSILLPWSRQQIPHQH